MPNTIQVAADIGRTFRRLRDSRLERLSLTSGSLAHGHLDVLIHQREVPAAPEPIYRRQAVRRSLQRFAKRVGVAPIVPKTTFL